MQRASDEETILSAKLPEWLQGLRKHLSENICFTNNKTRNICIYETGSRVFDGEDEEDGASKIKKSELEHNIKWT
jgi:hypothetical protein